MNRSLACARTAILVAGPVSGQRLDATAELMKALTEAPGPPPFEEDEPQIVVQEFEALGADIQFDGLGSVIATDPDGSDGRCGQGDPDGARDPRF